MNKGFVNSRQHGFTLVELIVVLVISGILASIAMQFITRPIDAYTEINRRARLVHIAETAMQRLSHDIQLAAPNSVRVGCAGSCVEMLRSVAGGRYRAAPPGNSLSFNPDDADTSFEVIGPLNHTGGLTTGSGASDCTDNTASCVMVYNTGQADSNAWDGDNLATLIGISGTPSVVSFNNGGFDGGQTAFPYASPGQRFYLIDTPVAFVCDAPAETLRRYEGYSIERNQADVDTHAELTSLSNPAEHALLASRVASCNFNYVPGTATRNAVLTVELEVVENGERVSLVQQLQVLNLP